MSVWLAVAVGGSLGAILRSACADWFVRKFPVGTFFVNVLGCFLIGLVTGWIQAHDWPSPIWRSFLIAGLFGSLTTFSTFGLQTVNLAQEKEWTLTLLYVGASFLVGLLAVWIGLHLGTLGSGRQGLP